MENFMIILALVLLAVGAALLLGREGVLRFALQLLPSLIEEAEEALGQGKGAEKKAAVLAKIREALPPPLRFLFSEERVGGLLEEVLAAMRELGEITDKEESA